VGQADHCARLYRAQFGSAIALHPQLDLAAAESYMGSIPFNRFSGGALVRASVFRLETGFLATRWGIVPCGAEEG